MFKDTQKPLLVNLGLATLKADDLIGGKFKSTPTKRNRNATLIYTTSFT